MAISKYTQPMPGFGRAVQPRINFDLVSKSLDRLTGYEIEERDAQSKSELIKQRLSTQVLEEERTAADEIISRYQGKIDAMGGAGPNANAASIIRQYATGMQGELAQISQNYATYQAGLKSYQDLAAKGKANAADYDYYITRPREELQKNPGSRLNIGGIEERVDAQALLDDFADNFIRRKGSNITKRPDGFYNNETNEYLDASEVAIQMQQFMAGNPQIQGQLKRDALYRARQNPELVEDLADELIEDAKEARDSVLEASRQGDQENPTVEEQDFINAANARIKDLQTNGALSDYVSGFVGRQMAGLAGPYANAISTLQQTTRLTRPLTTRAGSTSGGPSEVLTMTSPLHTGERLNPNISPIESMSADETVMRGLDEKMESALTDRQKAGIQGEKDFLAQEMSFKQAFARKALMDAGLDPNAFEKLQAQRDALGKPTGYSEQQWLGFFSRDSPQGIFRGGTEEEEPNPADVQEYIIKLKEFNSDMSDLQNEMNNVIQSAMETTPYSSTAPQAILKKASQVSEVLRMANAHRNVGVEVYDMAGNQITKPQDIPQFTTANADLAPINGKWYLSGKDKDDIEYRLVVTNPIPWKKWLRENVAQAAHNNKIFYEDIMRIPDTGSQDIIRNDKSILPEGMLIQRQDTEYILVDKNTFAPKMRDDRPNSPRTYSLPALISYLAGRSNQPDPFATQ